MTSPLTRAEFLQQDFRRAIALQSELLPPAALIVALLLALAGGVAAAVTQSWVAILVVVLLTVVQRLVIARRARVASTAMLIVAGIRPELSRWEPGDMASVPHHLLEPEDAQSPEALERILAPTVEDRRALAAAAPVVVALPSFAALAVGLGILLVLAAVIATVLGARGPGILAPVAAGIPLLALGIDFYRMVGTLRRVSAIVVERAREQLPRLWDAAPHASSGAIVRSVGDGYALDESALPLRLETGRWAWLPPVLIVVIGVLALAIVLHAQFVG